MALRAAASSAADEAELWTLIERAIKEEDSGRYALTATLYGRAEAAATKLHGELSLIPVYLRSRRAKALVLQAQCGAAVDDVEQWRAEAWALEERNVKVVERREAEATLKPGTCRAVEITFYKKWTQLVQRLSSLPALPPPLLNIVGSMVGVACLVLTAHATLFRVLDPPELEAGTQRACEAFVLKSIGLMLDASRAMPRCCLSEEETFAGAKAEQRHHEGRSLPHACATEAIITLQPNVNRPAFRAALRKKWAAQPVQAMLRARHVIEAVAANDEFYKTMEANRREDVDTHGLHPCGLPSCDKREVSVKQFKYCGDCEAEWYCCAEHQVLHWKEHKPICRARAADAAAAAVAAATLD